MIDDATRETVLSRLSSWFCRPVDNAFTLDKYMQGGLIMVGDEVAVHRRLRRDGIGEVVRLTKHRDIDNFEVYAVTVATGSTAHRLCPDRVSLRKRREHYRDHWANVYGGGIGFYEDALSRDDQEAFDDGPFSATTSMTQDFFWGLGLLQVGHRGDLAMRFLRRVIDKADHMIETGSVKDSVEWRGLLYGEVLRRKVYASAILGNGLDRPVLTEAAQFIAETTVEIAPSYWSADKQDRYLSAARMALIGDDIDLARDLLASGRSFAGHKDQRSLVCCSSTALRSPNCRRDSPGNIYHSGVSGCRGPNRR